MKKINFIDVILMAILSVIMQLSLILDVGAQDNRHVNFRIGYHQDFDRIVFDWQEPTTFRTYRSGDVITITFDREARFLQAAKPTRQGTRLISSQQAEIGPTRLFLLEVAADTEIRTIDMDDDSIVIDVWKAGSPALPSRPEPEPVQTSEESVRSPMLEVLPEPLRDAYSDLQRTPDDLGKHFDLARKFEMLAVAQGPRDGHLALMAKRLYERMLAIEPNLPEVHLRLGYIHFRRAEYAAARSYFNRVTASGELLAAEAGIVQSYLDRIQDELAIHKVSGRVLAGIRHRDNANAAPSDRSVLFSGAPSVIDDDARRQADQDVFLSMSMTHAYDPGLQSTSRIETRLTAQAIKQFDETEADTLAATVSTGPRLVLNKAVDQLTTARPHLLLRAVGIDGALFAIDVGGGVEAARRLGRTVVASGQVQAVHQQHNQTQARPDLDERDGAEISGDLGLTYRPLDILALNTALLGRWNDAESPARAFVEYGLEAGATLKHVNPLRPTFARASTGLDLRWQRRLFDAGDPEVLETTRRDDQRYRAELTSELPLTNDFGLVASGGYTRVDSSLANFDYRDWDAALALSYRF